MDDTILNRENTIWIVVLSLVGQVGVPAAQVLAIEQRDPASLTFFAAADNITRDCQTHDNEQESRYFPRQALRSQHHAFRPLDALFASEKLLCRRFSRWATELESGVSLCCAGCPRRNRAVRLVPR